MPESQAKFRFWWFFFSLKGRVTRVPVWYFVLPLHVIFLTFDIVSRIVPQNSDKILFENPWFIAGLALAGFYVLLCWPIFAIVVKRLHDIGLSGMAALPCLYPLLIILALGLSESMYHSGIDIFEYIPFFRTDDYAQYVLSAYYIYASILILASALIPGNKASNRYGNSVLQTVPATNEVF